MLEHPPVSCLCLTYGRPRLLEEAVESFLRQDYAGRKELVILNDLDKQELALDHPEVTIVNLRKRFHTVGEKRNASVALASHDLLFVWDDDDIYLPHRISYSVQRLDERKGFFKPSKAFTLNNATVGGPASNLFHSGSCFVRSLFDRAHGYPHVNSGQDLGLELAFEKILGPGKNFNAISLDEIYYLYRWNGTGSYHLSGFGRDRAKSPSGSARVEEYVRRELAGGSLETGVVPLRPGWKNDYLGMTADYVRNLANSAAIATSAHCSK